MPTLSVPSKKITSFFRSLTRDEVLLQGSFLVGTISLLLLIGQSNRIGDDRTSRPVEYPQEQTRQVQPGDQ